jgi:tetratricopeptide (TPR) repeat protein
VEKAITLFSKGQKAAGKQILDQLIVKYGTNFPIWLYRADYFFGMDDTPEVEKCIEKALELNPNSGYAYFLKGELRRKEGEEQGAMILYRKALELLPYPNNLTLLSRIGFVLANLELGRNNHLAALPLIEFVRKASPNDQQLTESYEAIYGESSNLPLSARRADRFRPQFTNAPSTKEWQAVVGNGIDTKLSDLVKGTAELAERFPDNPAAWFNAGFAKALIGNNQAALQDLWKSLELDNNPETQAETGALIMVLRSSRDFANEADFTLHLASFNVKNTKTFKDWLDKKQRDLDFQFTNINEEGTEAFGMFTYKEPRLTDGKYNLYNQAHARFSGSNIQMFSLDPEKIAALFNEIHQVDADCITPPVTSNLNAGIAQCIPFIVPTIHRYIQPTEQDFDNLLQQTTQDLTRFFEERWLNMPLKSLNGLTPLQASTDPKYQKLLRGIIRHYGESVKLLTVTDDKQGGYDPNRLLRKLGLLSGSDSVDFDVMRAEDLAGVQTEKLTDEQLLKGFQAAIRLNADEAASRFAKTAITRSTIADRFVFFNHLIGQATGEDVLKLLDEAIACDAATNNGSRAKDLASRKARLLIKNNQVEEGLHLLDSLLATETGNLNLYGMAAETLLGAKQAQLALKYAENGEAIAKKANDKDRMGYFAELIAATKKQIAAETPPPSPPAAEVPATEMAPNAVPASTEPASTQPAATQPTPIEPASTKPVPAPTSAATPTSGEKPVTG